MPHNRDPPYSDMWRREKKADAFADELEKTGVTETIFKLQTADSMAFYKLQTVWILSPPQS